MSLFLPNMGGRTQWQKRFGKQDVDPDWILLLDLVFACSSAGLGFFGKKSKYIFLKSVFIHVVGTQGDN